MQASKVAIFWPRAAVRPDSQTGAGLQTPHFAIFCYILATRLKCSKIGQNVEWCWTLWSLTRCWAFHSWQVGRLQAGLWFAGYAVLILLVCELQARTPSGHDGHHSWQEALVLHVPSLTGQLICRLMCLWQVTCLRLCNCIPTRCCGTVAEHAANHITKHACATVSCGLPVAQSGHGHSNACSSSYKSGTWHKACSSSNGLKRAICPA